MRLALAVPPLVLLKRCGVWASFVACAVAVDGALSFVSGPLSYQGATDVSSIELAWRLYGVAIAGLVRTGFAFNLLVIAALSLPFAAGVMLRRDVGRREVGLAALGTAGAWFLWIAVACVRIPTLFAEIYYGDGTGLTAEMMRFLCSVPGVVVLALVTAGVFALLFHLSRWRVTVAAAVAVAVFAAVVARAGHAPRIDLPDGSVVILMADSLRSDHFSAERSPRLHALATEHRARVVPEAIPPVARTTPAVVSLLTGRLPAQTGVTTMFSPASTFDQRKSLVSAYGAKGYCTAAVGDYPAEMLHRYDLGFQSLDVPKVRFKEIALQTVMAKNALLLATLSHLPVSVRRKASAFVSNLFEGLPTYSAPERLMRRLYHAVRACEGRPIFALVFADQPHFPYVQTWPHYLQSKGDYAGRYMFSKDPVSVPSTAEDKARIRELYRTSLLASDAAFAELIDGLGRHGELERSTVIVTGDHGESLYDGLGIMGHGDQLGELEGIAVPWIVFGKDRARFAFKSRSAVQTTELAEPLARINGIRYRPARVLPEGTLYVETDLWMADTPSVPRQRIRYPELSELLTLSSAEDQLELMPEFGLLVELAKHRMWIVDGVQYRLEPSPSEWLAFRDGNRISVTDLPPLITTYLRKNHPDVAPALLH